MSGLWVLRKPLYFGLTIALTVVLAWLYTSLSLRSAGMQTTVLTTRLATPQFEIDTFGRSYYFASVGLDILIALLTAVLISLTVASYRARRGAATGTVGSAASLGVAAMAFG